MLQHGFGCTVQVPNVGRVQKPRVTGLTMVIDKGLPLHSTAALFAVAGDFIDYLKLGFGTALLYSAQALAEKIRLARDYGVGVYAGGTLLELATSQGTGEAFIDQVAELGFTALEVSEGTIDLTPKQRRYWIQRGVAAGLEVVSEVGKKDPRHPFHPHEAAAVVAADLDAGARLVIVEGRDSGTSVGMYDAAGAVNERLSEELVRLVPSPDVLMWEAPRPSQHTVWLEQFGCNVNLGNIQTDDVVSLEALRNALRGDTLSRHLGYGSLQRV